MLDLTLGIPIYNSRDTLEQTVRSVANQRLRPREIYLLDDASMDGSFAYAQELVARCELPHAVVLKNERNLGIAGAYNRLASLAKSTWTQILDADDTLENGYYEAVAEFLRSDVAALVTGMRTGKNYLDGIGKVLETVVPTRPPLWLALLGSAATRSGVIYHSARLKELPFFEPCFDGSDIIHLLQLRLQAGCLFVPQAKVRYRIHPGASSANASLGPFREALREYPRVRPFYTVDLWCRKGLFGFVRRGLSWAHR